MKKLDVNVNKYYTPTIDEFCVGFRFEVLNNEIWEWQHMNASRLQEINFDDNTNNMSKYRVRYLDKTDIESLGFVCIPVGKEAINGIIYNIDVYQKGEYSSVEDCTIIYPYPLENYYHIVSNAGSSGIYSDIFNTRYSGEIKNKSELVKLLKMLRINE